jgi:alpha-tubulin suppressor-like RCC1 family protein
LHGQLGDGSTTSRAVPVAVAGGITFTSLTAGWFHTCGLTADGTAYCWGWNNRGQLGDGSTASALAPVAVAGGIRFASLTASWMNTCGLTSGGAAYCWGWNNHGQLGEGSTTQRPTPVPVAGSIAFASLITGGLNTCGLTSEGFAYCWGANWGANSQGGVGVESTTQHLTPMAAVDGITFTSLTVAAHICGLTNSGAAYCWGDNGSGALGDGTFASHTAPVAVAGRIAFASLAVGRAHTCGLTSGGAAYCWGANNYGQLGGPTTGHTATAPVGVAGGITFASLTGGRAHTCGLTSGGAAYCWGANNRGQLGDGSNADHAAPVAVAKP